MVNQEFIKKLTVKTDSRIVLLVMDGLGGIQGAEGQTELEKARHPNLDRLAEKGICGLTHPISAGITPGSGPSHLALFGYDPLQYEIGRGLLDGLGIDFELGSQDLVARGNFATIDEKGLIVDRRAGRIATEKNQELCVKLSGMEIEGVKIFVVPVKEHRVVVVFRGENLYDRLLDSDPQKEGLAPLPVKAVNSESEKSAGLVNKFMAEVKKRLFADKPANMILLRGFAKMLDLPSFQEVYQLNPAAIATYPMYKGISRLVGMKVLPCAETMADEFKTLEYNFSTYDFFFVHIKKTDSYGEDGDFEHKVQIIEEVDRYIPQLEKLGPQVIVVTGDHSTPSKLKSHSWHPVPLLLYSDRCRYDGARRFSETECLRGGLGQINSSQIMALALANAGKLIKYGA